MSDIPANKHAYETSTGARGATQGDGQEGPSQLENRCKDTSWAYLGQLSAGPMLLVLLS